MIEKQVRRRPFESTMYQNRFCFVFFFFVHCESQPLLLFWLHALFFVPTKSTHTGTFSSLNSNEMSRMCSNNTESTRIHTECLIGVHFTFSNSSSTCLIRPLQYGTASVANTCEKYIYMYIFWWEGISMYLVCLAAAGTKESSGREREKKRKITRRAANKSMKISFRWKIQPTFCITRVIYDMHSTVLTLWLEMQAFTWHFP